MSAFTFNEGASNARNGIHLLQFQREPDAGLQIMSGFQRIEDDVDIRTGYIDQVDVQSFDLMTGYAWRYNEGLSSASAWTSAAASARIPAEA